MLALCENEASLSANPRSPLLAIAEPDRDTEVKPPREFFMDSPRRALIDQFLGFVKELRFPWLVAILIALLLVNVVVLDPIPFVDEILLGLAAAVLASLKKGRRKAPVIEGDVVQPGGKPAHLVDRGKMP
jgi:hypothetical protein